MCYWTTSTKLPQGTSSSRLLSQGEGFWAPDGAVVRLFDVPIRKAMRLSTKPVTARRSPGMTCLRHGNLFTSLSSDSLEDSKVTNTVSTSISSFTLRTKSGFFLRPSIPRTRIRSLASQNEATRRIWREVPGPSLSQLRRKGSHSLSDSHVVLHNTD